MCSPFPSIFVVSFVIAVLTRAARRPLDQPADSVHELRERCLFRARLL